MLAYLLIMTMGSSIGSFLGSCAYRFPRRLPVTLGRSHCERCQEELAWFEIVPMVSFLALRGRCRHCHGRIPARLLLWEVGGGMAFILLFENYGAGFDYIQALLAASFASLVIVVDWEYRMIPDRALIVGSLFVVGFLLLTRSSEITGRLLSGGSIALVLFGVRAAFSGLSGRTGLGLGDVKLAGLIGLAVGFSLTLIAIWVAAILALTYDVTRRLAVKAVPSSIHCTWAETVLLLEPNCDLPAESPARESRTLDERIPFGSFLSVSSCLVFITSDHLSRFLLPWVLTAE